MEVIAQGSKVKQKVPTIEGEVGARRFNESASQMEYQVSYKDADGEQHQRWFLQSELEVTGKPAPTTTPAKK